ncbi:hypothetical protein Tco_1149227 [Tanacetum coccineum]
MRDFHKTHPSGSGAVKIIPSVTSEGTGVKPGVPDVTEEESSKSEVKSWGNDEDDSNNEQDSSDEDIDQKNDSDDNKIQSDNANELDSEHETDENESGSESDQEEKEEDKDEEEEVNTTNIPHTDAEIVSQMDVHVTGSPNLHNLNNLLILIGMLTGIHNKDRIKAG